MRMRTTTRTRTRSLLLPCPVPRASADGGYGGPLAPGGGRGCASALLPAVGGDADGDADVRGGAAPVPPTTADGEHFVFR
ncbi:hypothetical protein B0H17DRAFT_1094673 [Mycena rosella]|uniref:Uncharacterized protein n=1 Tax=Mycena rosella TaxID=1033263 RepID=A0AAD7G6L1_MYCRO|nr:hypothetical protein B0H17DRAFT_1094673 [Mycena rosella]